MTISIAKCKLEIEARGCIECGTEWARHWTPAREIIVKVGKRTIKVLANKCDRCAAAIQYTHPLEEAR